MSLPRPILPGKTYLITRRCTQRQFLLRPSSVTNQVLRYCLALAQRATGVELHAVVAMSNHYHSVGTDPRGLLPAFDEIVNKYVAKALNVHYDRCENLWAAGVQPSHVELGDDNALLEQAAYTICNPVEALLVRRHQDWPGLLLWHPGRYKVKRPGWFFRDDEAFPRELELVITPLPFSDQPKVREATERLGAAVLRRETELRAQAKAAGRAFGTLEQLRRIRHTDSSLTVEGRRTVSPRVASRDKWRRIELLQRLKSFAVDYRDAFRRWRDGARDVVFPAGSYRVKHLFGVRCAEC